MTGYVMNFNQDFTSISVLSETGFRLFPIGNGSDNIDEIFSSDTDDIRLVERLFNSSLVVLVTKQKPNSLKMLHFKKKQDICNCVYPSDILSVRMNRQRLIVCLAESIHIHDIRDMKILHSIDNIAPNELGLCSLSMSSSQLAFPVCTISGEFRIFDANKLKTGLTIKAHDSKLSALSFADNGMLIATASERGTVIRVFSVISGQRVQEFRRGVKRCVRIASLVFSPNAEFLCASSNTATVHIFKIDLKVLENHQQEKLKKPAKDTTAAIAATAEVQNTETCNAIENSNNSSSWSGYFTKAVSSYLIPTQVSDVLAQDRAFATAVLSQPGLKHVCGLTHVQKEIKLLIACEDGFLYVHDLNVEQGGPCKIQRVHDLRYALDGVIELSLTDSLNKVIEDSTTADANAKKDIAKTAKSTTISTTTKMTGKSCAASVIFENPDALPDNTYAGILKGVQAGNALTDSAKFRKLCDAIDTPKQLFDERQFPPVAIAAKD